MSCAIAIMAKAPRAGHSKTRLSPPLLPDEARQMSAAFLRDISENILAAAAECDGIEGYVAFSPPGLEHLFDGVLAPGTELILADGSIAAPPGVEGFGRSLWHATQALFERGHDSVCVLNSDSPTLPTRYLVAAAHRLGEGGDAVVLGPAEDGGYYLLGMTRPHPSLYAGIAWSTERVAGQTRNAAAEIGLAVHDLPEWYDVDDRHALERLLREFNSGGPGYTAPATTACVQRLGLRSRLAA